MRSSSTDVPVSFILIVFLLKFNGWVHDASAQPLPFVPTAKWYWQTENNLEHRPNFGGNKLSWRDTHLATYQPKYQDIRDDDNTLIFGASTKRQVPNDNRVKNQVTSRTEITDYLHTDRDDDLSPNSTMTTADELDIFSTTKHYDTVIYYHIMRDEYLVSNSTMTSISDSNTEISPLNPEILTWRNSFRDELTNPLPTPKKQFTGVTLFEVEDHETKILSENMSESLLINSFSTPHIDSVTRTTLFQVLDNSTSLQISKKKINETWTQRSLSSNNTFGKNTGSDISAQVLRSPSKYPYLVSIWLRYEIPEYHTVGTLISLRHVLTAAHSICWKSDEGVPVPFDDHMIGVRMASRQSTDLDEEYDVLYKLIHFKWWQSKQKIRPYDAAILVLKTEVELDLWSNLVEIVPLQYFHVMSTLYNYTNCISLHWSHEQSCNSTNDGKLRLITTKTKLISLEFCNNRLKDEKSDKVDRSLEVCSIMKEIEGSCQGDSDRVLICEGKQVGILSNSGVCTEKDRIQIYTRVDILRHWIEEMMTPPNKTLVRKMDEYSENDAFKIFPSKLPIVLTAVLILLSK